VIHRSREGPIAERGTSIRKRNGPIILREANDDRSLEISNGRADIGHIVNHLEEGE